MIDVLNVIGHDLKNPGARGYYGRAERYELGAWVPSFVRAQRAINLQAKLDMRRVEVEGYDARYDDLIARCTHRNPRILYDYHHNSGGKYGGVVCIVPPGNNVAGQLARKVGPAIAAVQGTRFRGVTTNEGADGKPRSWTGQETQSPDGNWYPAGPTLRLLDELPATIIPVVLEFYDGDDKGDYDAALTAFKANKTQTALAKATAEFLAELDSRPNA